MFREEGGRPGDQRGFLHRSFIGKAVGGLVKRVIPAVGVASAIVSTVSRAKARPTVSRTLTARSTVTGSQQRQLGLSLKFPDDTGVSRTFAPDCKWPRRLDPRTGECRVFIGEESGRDRPRAEREGFVGDAVMGQFGAALEPGVMQIERSVCLPGMHLAKDGLCYNKGAITNSQRMWPRGRRPLLTGGDMRAIGIAARAGSKLDRTTKRLRALGMMKALPKSRTTKAHAHAKPVAAVSV